MKTIFILILLSAFKTISSQQMIVPNSILTHGRANFYTMHYFSYSFNENGVRLFMHSDLFANRYPNLKIAADYYRHDYFINREDIETLRLKANYRIRISRTVSIIFSGSGGITKPNDPSFIYSGGFTFNRRALYVSYHLFDLGSELLHSTQFYTSPFIKFKKESKFIKSSGISFSGNYVYNKSLDLPYCSNYIQMNLELNVFNISLGVHQSSNQIQPNFSLTLKDLEFFDISTTLFLNKQRAPDLQVSVLFKKRRFKHRGFVNISNPNF